MRDQTAIATKLAALAAKDDVFKDGQRIISHDAPPLVAVLREIDDTVLERTLVFGIGDAALHAVVAGRRLRGVVEISGDLPGMEDVVGKVLSREDMETVSALGKILHQLCAKAGSVSVLISPVRPIGSSAEAGLATATLADVWGVDQDAEPASLLSRLLSTIAAQITASLHVVDGQPPQTTGDAILLEAVWDAQVTAFRKRHRSIMGTVDSPMLISLDSALAGNPIALAIADGEQCLISFKIGALPDILSTWATISGR